MSQSSQSSQSTQELLNLIKTQSLLIESLHKIIETLNARLERFEKDVSKEVPKEVSKKSVRLSLKMSLVMSLKMSLVKVERLTGNSRK